MNKHTPGPWVIRKGDEWAFDVVTHHGELPDGSPNAWNIATINGRRDEARENLALIASAPGLLDALEQCKGHLATVLFALRKDNPRHSWIPEAEKGLSEAKAAIAKAKGESS